MGGGLFYWLTWMNFVVSPAAAAAGITAASKLGNFPAEFGSCALSCLFMYLFKNTSQERNKR
jgi:hypothetical protein